MEGALRGAAQLPVIKDQIEPMLKIEEDINKNMIQVDIGSLCFDAEAYSFFLLAFCNEKWTGGTTKNIDSV